MDELLAKHFAHLFIRDPLVIYEELLIQPPEGTNNFEVFSVYDRIYRVQIGRRCGLSHLVMLKWVGESNSDLWIFN
jgi:hypothetical protein